MGEEKEILLRGKVCAYLTWRLMGDPDDDPLDPDDDPDDCADDSA